MCLYFEVYGHYNANIQTIICHLRYFCPCGTSCQIQFGVQSYASWIDNHFCQITDTQDEEFAFKLKEGFFFCLQFFFFGGGGGLGDECFSFEVKFYVRENWVQLRIGQIDYNIESKIKSINQK